MNTNLEKIRNERKNKLLKFVDDVGKSKSYDEISEEYYEEMFTLIDMDNVYRNMSCKEKVKAYDAIKKAYEIFKELSHLKNKKDISYEDYWKKSRKLFSDAYGEGPADYMSLHYSRERIVPLLRYVIRFR